MMHLANRIQKVAPSLTLAISAKAKRLKKEGVDIISFSAGEPDFDTPDAIKAAAIQALQKGATKYTPASGTLELKEAISKKLAQENQLTYAADQIVVSCGAKHAIYNALQVLINKGDEVIIPGPYWLSYPEMVTLAGGTSKILNTTIEREYLFDPKALEALITKKTKVLILNSPSNPSGAVMDKSMLTAIAAISKKHSFYIISDEIYEHLVYDSRKHVAIGALDPEILERTITVNGASKCYSMTGWRLGFLAAPKAVAKACTSLQSHSTSNPTAFAQAGYLYALQNGAADIERMRVQFEKRRNMMVDLVKSIPKLKCFTPGGAFYLFVDISETKLKSLDFADRLLDEAKVAVIPGVAFGDDHAIRLSFATSEDQIELGCSRLREWLKKI
jgi:aspartate aminotransferase